ncbi:MAG: ATP-dependent Clp protease proteolytic subunit [Candidatus Azobacteroides sp.]|nr:ATP-dependent Clp protease proteolytic subunit [Candidatus Azobacteroides sp.]
MLEVQIYDDIANKKEQAWLSLFGMDDCVFSADTMHKILRDHPNEKEIKFNIHCDGGSVSEGLTIYDILRNSGRNIFMNVEGSCHSMAIILLLAAPFENRTGNANLRALIHRVYCPVSGYYTADELNSLSENIKQEEDAILDIYEERTGKNRASLAAWMKSEKTRTAQELLNMNFISKINSYNTNLKNSKMNKNGKPVDKAGKKAKAIENSRVFLNKLGKLLNPGPVNFDYQDTDGNTVFSTDSEEDTLAVGDTVILADGGTEGTFTLSDGRVVSIVDNTVTEIEEPASGDEELKAANVRIEELENFLRESQTVITDLKNQVESNFTPPKRTITKQNPSNVKKTSEELKAEAIEKRNKAFGGAN